MDLLDDDSLVELRNRVARAAEQPEFAELVTRGRARRRRHQVVGSVVAAVVALLVGAVLAINTVGGPDAAPSPASTRPTRTVDGDTDPVAVRFADQLRGFAVVGCAPDAGCQYQLLASEDGGRTWAVRNLPLRTRAGETIRLAAPGAVSVVAFTPTRRLFSPDAGRTWQEAPNTPDPTWQGITGQPTVYVRCPRPGATACVDGTAVVVHPGTGRDHTLPFAWRGIGAVSDAGRLPTPADGSVWVGATTTDGALPVVVVRRSNGEWRSTRLPTGTDQPAGGVTVLSRDGRTGYALVRPAGRRTLAGLFATSDGGGTWRSVPPPAAGSRPDGYQGAALLADGAILLTDLSGRLLLSRDGGRTFTALRPNGGGPALSWIDTASGRYLAAGADGGWYTSTDGLRWTELTF